MLKNRSEEHAKMYEYASSLNDRMGALERIGNRLAEEQKSESHRFSE